MTNLTRKCPFCGGEIELGVKKCKHCGEWLMQQEKGCGCAITFLAWTVGIIVLLATWSDGIAGVFSKLFRVTADFFSGRFWYGLFLALCTVVVVELYFIPTRIALKRKHQQLPLIIGLNIVGFIIPIWFCALILACVRCRGENSIW